MYTPFAMIMLQETSFYYNSFPATLITLWDYFLGND